VISARAMAQCKVCSHGDRAAMETALARGVGIDTCHRRWPDVSRDSFQRHRGNPKHMPAAVMDQLKSDLLTGMTGKIDLRTLREQESQGLLANLVGVRAQLQALANRAIEFDSVRGIQAAAQVYAQILSSLKVVGQLLQEFGPTAPITNNLIVSPSYLLLRSGLMKALANHPAARADVARVLAEIEQIEAVEKDEPILTTGTKLLEQ
jgi:hypothetical protein